MQKTIMMRSQKGGISNCVGRYDYITNEQRQEHLEYTYSNVDQQYWVDLHNESSFGNRARDCQEYIYALPNSAKDNIALVADRFVQHIEQEYGQYGVGYQIAIHNNEGNLHAHVMFSERVLEHPENTPHIELKEERARTYYFMDKERVNKETGEIEHYQKKFKTLQEYEAYDGPKHIERTEKKVIEKLVDLKFGNKIEELSTQEFMEQQKEHFVDFCNELELELGTEIQWQREVLEGHLAQAHRGQGNSEIAQQIEEHNQIVVELNRLHDLDQQLNVEEEELNEEVSQFIEENQLEEPTLEIEPREVSPLEKLQEWINKANEIYKEFMNEIKHTFDISRLRTLQQNKDTVSRELEVTDKRIENLERMEELKQEKARQIEQEQARTLERGYYHER